MTIEDGKIVKCTDQELYKYWLDMWADLYDYEDYKKRCIANGTEVVDGQSDLL